MFVAPLSLPSIGHSAASGRRNAAAVVRAPIDLLLFWLAAGVCLLAFVPVLRGGALLGETLPFWLVAAPAIDIVWLARGRTAATVRSIARRCRPHAAAQAKRVQPRRRSGRTDG